MLGIAAAAPATDAAPVIAWSRIRNPLVAFPDRALKDPALVWTGRQWVLLDSSVSPAGHWSVGITTSRDLTHWSQPTSLPHDPAVEGEASPDVARTPDGSFVVTYQSFVHDAAGAQAKLYARRTTDFTTFSEPHPLGRELHPAATDRLIDPALAWTPAGLLLAYKYGPMDGPQAFEIARSSTGSLDGPWVEIGRPDIRVLGDTIENYQLLHVAGRWRLLATSNAFDRPYLFDLAGDPRRPDGWLHWSRGRQLQIPQERWNHGRGMTGVTYEHANGAYLVDGRPIRGFTYLVYSDSPEVTTFGGAGPAKLALARSADLRHWAVPPG